LAYCGEYYANQSEVPFEITVNIAATSEAEAK
jgi:hypothetical protein